MYMLFKALGVHRKASHAFCEPNGLYAKVEVLIREVIVKHVEIKPCLYHENDYGALSLCRRLYYPYSCNGERA